MSPISPLQDISDRLDRFLQRRQIISNPVSAFQVAFNDTTKGATVSFTLVKKAGIGTLVLKRNFSLDKGSADVVNTWEAQVLNNGQAISFEDTNQQIKNQSSVYYWLECQPRIDDFPAVTIGPQTMTLGLDQGAPNAIAEFDASHEAVSGGTVMVGIAFKPPVDDSRFGSCKIAIAGYNGIAARVEIAQNATSPFRFALEQTGETVTLSAIAVSLNGVESTATAPTKSLTLGAAATVPAKIIGASATELSGGAGVQITFPAGPESNITQYQVYRGPRQQGFAAAASIGTVAPTGASAYIFTDANGLTGVFEWYVFAVNSAGNGAASDVIIQDQAQLSSSDAPVNDPSNTTNHAVVTSSDAGTDATIDVSGTGGAGTSWTRPTGHGTETLPHFTVLHAAYSTKYWVVYDTVNKVGLAFTDQTQALGDNYAFAGTVTTVQSGGAGGTTGGGGTSGGSGGGIKLPQ